jgi:hypothetical protein
MALGALPSPCPKPQWCGTLGGLLPGVCHCRLVGQCQ